MGCVSNNSGDKSQTNNSLWTKEIKELMLEGCNCNSPIKGMTEEQTKEYCDCILAKTMVEFPNPEDIGESLPDEFVKKAGIECLEEMGIYESTTENMRNNQK